MSSAFEAKRGTGAAGGGGHAESRLLEKKMEERRRNFSVWLEDDH